jgi:hypothetical protein
MTKDIPLTLELDNTKTIGKIELTPELKELLGKFTFMVGVSSRENHEGEYEVVGLFFYPVEIEELNSGNYSVKALA